MPRGWKRLAERADKKAYAPEEICDALPAALEMDWHAGVLGSLCRQVRAILNDNQGSLFGDQMTQRLEALRGKTAGYPLGAVFLDCAILVAAKGRTGDQALKEAACDALSDRASRGARQVEEHYRRESTKLRAAYVRERIESGIMQSNISKIAGYLVGIDKSDLPRAPAKQTGLDDGVQL